MKLKGIATETIFYIVIGIVVVGLLVTLVISYTGTARKTTDCKLAEQRFCEYWESNPTASESDLNSQYDAVNGNCETDYEKADPNTLGHPTSARCKVIGYGTP